MNFKKLISAFMAFGIAAGMSALNVNAAADNGFTQAEISASEIKPYITLTSKLIDYETLWYNNSVTVQVMVDTEDYSYAATGLHIYYDDRLSIRTDSLGQIDVKKGEAAENLTFEASEDPTAESYGMKGIFISTAGDYNGGKSGVLAEITFKLPNYAYEGDVYPLDIVYKENDEFTTFDNDDTGKLMQAWTFTQGIYNPKYNNNFYAPYSDVDRCWNLNNHIYGGHDGYIAIENLPFITTTMANTTRTTISTTTTTTTAMPTITVPYTTTLSYTTTPRPTTTMTYTTTYTMTARPTITMPYTTTLSYTTTPRTTTTVSHTTTPRTTTTVSHTTTPRTTTTVLHTTTPQTTTITTTKPSGISIIPDKITMNAGDTNRLALIGAANSEDIIWTSGNTAVASVDENGKVTAKKAGKAEIFAVYNNQSASCIVTVVSGDVTGITLIGDANGDNELSVADATLILQYCGNKDKYKISEQGLLNADVDGTPGISPLDALIIQQVDAGIYDISDLPLTK